MWNFPLKGWLKVLILSLLLIALLLKIRIIRLMIFSLNFHRLILRIIIVKPSLKDNQVSSRSSFWSLWRSFSNKSLVIMRNNNFRSWDKFWGILNKLASRQRVNYRIYTNSKGEYRQMNFLKDGMRFNSIGTILLRQSFRQKVKMIR